MSELIADLPFILEVQVRDSFLYDGESGHDGFTPGYLMGFRAVPGRVPAFQVMLQNGAQWANVPIHMLSTKPCAPIEPEIATWWDCFSSTFSIVRFSLAKNLRCTCRGRDGKVREGNYLFTVDWTGLWADIPDQHKQHHVIAAREGQLLAYPNNKVFWQDESYVDEEAQGKEMPRYKPNSHEWSVEGRIK